MTVRFDVLGELKVWEGVHSRAVTAEKQRTILAVLIAARGLDVSVDRLLDSVWEIDQPSNGRSALRFHISKLRSIIQPDGQASDSVIQTTATGYRLEGSLAEVDAWTLRDRVESCSLVAAEHRREAIETLQQAVDSYGMYLGEFAYAEFAQQPRREWDEFVISTALTCADLLVEAGGPDGAAALLQPLLEANPYREAIASKLVLALHGAERQVEALRTYDHVREQLADVGVVPGPELQSSLDQVLAADVAPSQRVPVRHNLPIQIERLIGRDEELTNLSGMLSNSRLLRVAGLPGVGKSTFVGLFAGTQVDTFRDGVIWIGENLTGDIEQDLATILTDLFVIPVDAANAAAAVAEMECLVIIDGSRSYGDIKPIARRLLGGVGTKVIAISDDASLDAPVFTVPSLRQDEAWSLFESVGGVLSDVIDGPDLLMETTGGIPALIRFGAAVLGAEAYDVLRASLDAASADLLDSALAVIDDPSMKLLAAVSAFSGPVSLIDVGGIDEEKALPDVLKLIDEGWLVSAPRGVEVPAVVADRLSVRGLIDGQALDAHARTVSSWAVSKAVHRFVDTERAIVHLAVTDVGDAVALFDRVAPKLWDAGRYGTLSRAAAALVRSGDTGLRGVLYYGAYAGLRVGDVELSRDCQERFDRLANRPAGHAIESALLAADIAWFEGRSERAAHEYAQANTLATAQGDPRAVLGAFGEAIVHAYTDDRLSFAMAKDRVISEALSSNDALGAEVLGVDALLRGDIPAAVAHFETGLDTASLTDRRSLQRRLVECHLTVGDGAAAEASWADIEADVSYTGVPMDPPTLFVGSVLSSRYRTATESLRLLHRGARSLSASPAALWILTGLAAAALIGRRGPHRERIDIAMARLVQQTGIKLLPPFGRVTVPSRGPVDLDEVTELLLATEAPTP